MKLDEGARTTILIHYYRAMVGRADIWRTRMDTTTNWAIGATAAILSFAWGDASSPHYVIHIASFLTVIFLLLEARRLTFYHLWQRRALLLERALIAPAMREEGSNEFNQASLEVLERELAPQLGSTVPSMSIAKAAARRLRRVYVYLFAAQLVAWLVKLAIHPHPVTSVGELAARASIGVVPGTVMLIASTIALAMAVVFAYSVGATNRTDADQVGGER